MTRTLLTGGWELAGTEPGAVGDPTGLDVVDEAAWREAEVPGTVAAALGPAAGEADLDGHDWWYRRRLTEPVAPPGCETVLVLGGLATLAEVFVNGELVLRSESMFAGHEVDVSGRLTGDDELTICLRALTPRLAERRRPRARWRTKLVADGNLRFFRTMLLGRAPGFAPGPPVVGPWREVAIEVRRGVVLASVRIRSRMREDNDTGVVEVEGRLKATGDGALPAALALVVEPADEPQAPSRGARLSLPVDALTGAFRGTAELARPQRWWPHTHGTPRLHTVTLADEDRVLRTERVGFRTLRTPPDIEAEGFAVEINGVPIFVRGVVWTPLSLERPAASEAELRPVLERLAGAGMNMLRVPGTTAYESDAFHDLCDELGILVFQDFMFANLDYPESDESFMATVRAEAESVLGRLGHRPGLAAVCGGSEVAQQVAMLGLDPGLASGLLFGELLPRLVADADVDAPYIPSAPWGGTLPFRPEAGVANYYGVGAYLRPLEDARRSGVRFATECLAFANVPDQAALDELAPPGALSVTDPSWKAGVPRDAGVGWDFEDVRDHYLRLLFGVDPSALRRTDQERYLKLSRVVSGEVMAETFGEWRRTRSSCAGALILWCSDLRPGAGWGILDHRSQPKVALHHLRRALAPVAVWSSDEGLSGVVAHVANDRPDALRARLRVALYRDSETLIAEGTRELELGPHTTQAHDIEAILGHFVDATWAYRFGPSGHDVIALSLEQIRAGAPELISQSFRFPAERPARQLDASALGLRARIVEHESGYVLQIGARRFAYGVRVEVPGHSAAEDSFGVEPGHERPVVIAADTRGASPPTTVILTAVNLLGRVRIGLDATASAE